MIASIALNSLELDSAMPRKMMEERMLNYQQQVDKQAKVSESDSSPTEIDRSGAHVVAVD